MSLADLCVNVLIGLALISVAISATGIVVARDPYDRLHFVAPAVLTAVLIAAAVLVRTGPSLISIKGGLMAAVLLVGSPLITHATARAGRIAAHEGPEVADEEEGR